MRVAAGWCSAGAAPAALAAAVGAGTAGRLTVAPASPGAPAGSWTRTAASWAAAATEAFPMTRIVGSPSSQAAAATSARARA